MTPVSGGDRSEPRLLADLFGAVVRSHPDRVAVTDGYGGRLTYAELDERSNRLARALIERGVRAEALVALAIPRSVELYTAMWAVTKTGGAYVPIDPDYPDERIVTTVEDSGVLLGLRSAASGELPDAGVDWIDVSEAAAGRGGEPIEPGELAIRPTADNTAYVIYTSGTTGRPKGVSVTHAGLANFAAQESERLGLSDGAVVLGYASPAFDASVLEYLLAIGNAGALRYRPADVVGGAPLAEFIREIGATDVFLTPAVLGSLDPSDVPPLNSLGVGGEALPPAVAAQWAGHTPLHNMYGPTEATVAVTISGPLDSSRVVLGSPIAGADLYVLDANLRPVPVGVPGELYAAGTVLARGYLGRPDLTAASFVANPFGAPGERLYRTGDIVRWVRGTDGELVVEYSGRSDDQVKLRGLRIELGEIEAVLGSHPAVESAVVIGVTAAGQRTTTSVVSALAGYVVTAEPIDVAALREFAATRLPAYMVPSTITVLDALPLTPVGKLDKRALPAPEIADAEMVAPENDAERAVAAAFAEVLGLDEVGVTASFFDLGGNSLSAMRAAVRAGEILDADLSVRDLFEAPTVRALVVAAAGHRGALAPIVAVVPRPAEIPLSFAQQRMWFINRLEPTAPTYNIPAVLKLSGTLDVPALRGAVVDLLERHEVLRTSFPALDGVPTQRIASVDEIEDGLDWAVVDSQDAVAAAVTTGFDVTAQWPLRVRLWEQSAGEYVLAVVAHHIGADGESMGPLVRDVVGAYARRVTGSSAAADPLPVQFADFAIWQHRVLGSPEDPDSVVGTQLAYWREHLAGAPDVLNLPMDRPRPAIASHRGRKLDFGIPAELGDRVAQTAQAAGVTPFMVVHAALAVLLGRLGATDDVSVATPIAGRGQQVLQPLVGMFVNTLVLRTPVSSGDTFDALLSRVKQVDLDAFAHADAPFETVVEAVGPVRSESFGPLAQVILAVTQTGSDQPGVDIGDLRVEPISSPEIPAQYDLHVNVAMQAGEAWQSSLVYATDLFDEASIALLADRFLVVLDAVTANPAAAVGDVDVLTAAERARLSSLPAPAVDPERQRSLVDSFAESASAHPASTAVSALGRSVSYAELDGRSSAIAAGLVAAGVRPGDLVGLATARSVDLVSSILGVLKAGAAYLPLDVTNPVDRLSYIVGDAGVGVVLTDSSTEDHGLWSVVEADVQVLDVDDLIVGNDAAGMSFVPVRTPAAARAYVIYTSGSTGLPKGVEVTHGDVAALMAACGEDFDFRADDVWTLFHSYAFDFSVWELWGPLFSGARVVIVDRDLARDIDGFVELLAAERVSVLSLTPSAFYQLIDARRRRDPELALRYVVFGGEELGFEHVRRWFDEYPADTAQLVNMYGITETTVHVTYRPIDRAAVSAADPSFIGRALSSLAIHILDDRLRPVPTGVVGEMYVAGGQLAQGYLNRPGLSATRFVANPFAADAAGSRLYRTGDLARWVGDDIEYLGRADGQVQLRGFRIEYGEVESALLSVDGVTGAAARIVTDRHRGDLLIGYVVGDAGATLDVADVREAAGTRVPRYMVPDLVIAVDRLPLTANGKLDRKALPLPDFTGSATEFAAPANRVEEAIAGVFADLLGAESISVTESFFDLGGNSLAATRLAARVAAVLDVDVTVRDVFDAPSVRELAEAIDGRGRQITALTARERPERLPLSTAQQRMWFINQFDTVSPAYNIPMGLKLDGALDLQALRGALDDLLDRHEVLRTVYPSDDRGPRQRILSAAQASELFVWTETADVAGLIESASSGFDVAVELPIRGAFRRTENGLDLVLTAHHIAFDGESNQVFVRDLLTAYLRRTGADVPAQPTLGVQYADFALWQREVLGAVADASSPMGRQMAYWREQLADLPAVTDLPMDRPRPAVLDTAAAVLSVDVDEALADGVERLARSHGATGFMVTHAALAITVARLAATTDVVIGSPIAGRTDAALEDLVGMFVNTLVLRTEVDPAQSVADFLGRVRGVDLDAFANADAQFDDLIEELAPERSTSHQPLVQIAFAHVSAGGGADLGRVELPGLTAEPLATAEPVAKFDLTVEVAESTADTPMTARFLYATSLFDDATVRRFADAWLRTLAAMIADPRIATGDIDLVGTGIASAVSRNSVGGTLPAADGGVSVPAPLPELLARRNVDPDHPALVCDGVELTYREFDARTDAVARALIERGVGPDDIVAIGLERSIDSVVAVFGVIKAGAAYVPIDPAYPQDRIDYMVADSGVRLGITDAATRGRLGDGAGTSPACEWLDVADISVGDAAPITAADRNGVVTVDNLAYLVYTSGSTGRPKAVGVSHRGLANFIDQFREVSGSHAESPDTRVLHVASPSFDASVLEMMWSIGLGHTLVIAPASEYAGEALGRILDRDGVTDTLITPTVLATVDPARGHRIRNLVTGGEACPPELIAKWVGAGSVADRTMYNFYGPSEATVWSLTGRSMPGQPVTIGHPVRGFAAYVLDVRLHPVPQGVVGELYLASDDSLARGYLGRPGQTSGSFVADPFSATPGARMYATGDLVRVNAHGEIEFAGRADDQVKINGQRVELGEIEAVLADLPAIDSAVVIGVRDASGRSRLAAYVVPAAGGEPAVDEILDEASQRLAAHMVPHVVTMLDALPLTPGGKLDRRALPEPELVIADDDLVAPASAAEETLAAIVAGLLGRERVGVTESFFAMGGDSIMSIQLASAARAAGLELTPREIFEHKSVRGMARVVAEGAERLPMIVEPGGPAGDAVVGPIVSWLIEAAPTAADFADFNQSMVLTAPDGVTGEQLGVVLDAVVRAHPMLTASLRRGSRGWGMSVGGDFDPAAAVTVIDADDALPDAVRAAHAADAAALDPTSGDLVRASLVRAEGEARVVLTVHHLAVDAVSWPILIEDLVTAWAQSSGGQPVLVRPEASSVRAWNAALSAHAVDRDGELSYWLARSPETSAPFGTAFDPVRDVYSETESVVHTVDTAVSEPLIAAVPQAFGGNATDAMLAALGRAVRSWQESTGIADAGPIAVLSEGHGRYEDVLADAATPARADLSRTVGWFTTIAPILVDPSDDPVHAVKAVKEERLGQPGHGVGYGLLRYRAGSALGDRPLPSIAFNYLGGSGSTAGAGAEGQAPQAAPFLPAPDAPFLPSAVRGRLAAMAPLVINASTVAGTDGPVLSADFRYAPAVLTGDDVRVIADNWSRELAAVVHAARGDVGLSPSDVPGSGISQADLDTIAEQHPGADVWPLTPLQRGLYFQSQLAGDAAVDVYVTQAVLHLGGDIDVERLRRATGDLLAHHGSLRSAFVQTGGGAVVGVVPVTVDVPWRVVDLGDRDGEAAAAEIDRVAAAEKLVPFDMAVAPLLRIVLVEHAQGASVVITNHHILFDGWSGPLVMADLLALYATGATYTGLGRPAGSETLDFADYARRIGRADHAAGLNAWREVLAPITEPTFVATTVEATADTMPRDLRMSLGAELTAAIEELSRRSGATVSTVLQFAWAVLMSRYTGNRVVTFGETVSGRPADLDGVESMVGLFINTLPVVVDVDPAAPALDVLASLQADKVKVLDHQHIGLPELTALTGLPALFDTLTVYESYPVDTDSLADADTESVGSGLQIRGAEVTDATHYPLNLGAAPTADGILLTVKYLPIAFSDGQAQVFADAVRQILSELAADAARPIGDIPLIAREALAGAVLPSPADAVEPKRVVDMIADREIDPDHPALIDGDEVITYADFEARTNRVARALIAEGVGPEDIVAVVIDRSVESVTAVWGTVKTGAAFVAIDPAHPDERIAGMLDDTRSRFGITVPGHLSRLAGFDPEWLLVDDLVAADVDDSDVTDADRNGVVRLDDLAYLIFTSGTTGRPKAAANHNRGLATMADRLAQITGTRDDHDHTRILHLSSPSFDASFFEMIWALGAGHTLVIAPASDYAGPALDALLARYAITDLVLTPSVLATLDVDSASALRNLIVCGEPCGQELVEKWAGAGSGASGPNRAGAGKAMFNFYGPSEATVISSTAILEAGKPVNVGTSVRGFTGYVLDARLQPVPHGFVGELYLSAPQGLGRGYLQRFGLTAERFVADPFTADGSRMYATGDLVRINDDAELEFAGRADFQVKIAGQRIELGEIESVLSDLPGVAAAVVIGVGEPASSLAAYVVPEGGHELSVDELRDGVRHRLPSFMVPASIMVIEEIPINAVGKLDRPALPEPEIAEAEYVAPASPDEEAVAAVFGEVLGLDRVGVTVGFFELGGNSLSATRLVARVSEALDVDVSVRDVFGAPSVRDLVRAVAGRGAALEAVSAVWPRPDRIPLSFAQQRIWFINQLESGSGAYNVPAVVRLTGALDVGALRAAAVDVVRRHEVLRTSFPSEDGVAYQLIHEPERAEELLDWAVVTDPADVERAVTSGFDLGTALPIRVRLLALGPDEHVLAVVAHHIAADGESVTPLVGDLVTAYAARAAGTVPIFAPLDVQYADYALWQHRVLGDPGDPASVLGRDLAYWTTQLSGLPDVLRLPTDRPRPPAASHRGAEVAFEIPAEVGERIAAVAAAQSATPFMVVHAALAALLARLSGTSDIAIATPIAGRGQRALDPLVGMFVNTLVLRTRIDGGSTFDQLIDQARVTDVDAFAHAAVPFEVLVDALNPTRTEAFSPLAQVMLSFGGDGAAVADEPVALGDLTVTPATAPEKPAQFDLTVNVSASDGAWTGSMIYATDLFDESTIRAAADRLVLLLDGLTADPRQAVGDASILSAEARAGVLGFSHGAETEPSAALIGAVVDRARRTPDAVAVNVGDATFTYGEVVARADALAAELAGLGIGYDDVVVLALDRSVHWIVGMIAAWKVGAAYAPVDPSVPIARLRSLVEDAAARVVVGVADWIDRHADDLADGVELVAVGEQRAVEPFADVPAGPAGRLGYVITTSGSTGRPKPTMVPLAGIENTIGWYHRELALSEGDGVLVASSPTFDLTQKNVWAALASGATVHLADAVFDPEQILQLLAERSIAVMNMAPSAFEALVESDGAGALAGLRTLFLGGEPVRLAPLRPLLAGGLRVFNSYGPTEASDVVSFREVTGDETGSVPIGAPIAGVDLLVLDARLGLVPVGVPGELYVGGVAVGRGYGGMTGLTAERFIANPFAADGSRMYRTGDLAQWTADGELLYLGRTDSQIKLRGLRIELGEIEAVLGETEGVALAAVTVAGEAGREFLAAYLSPASAPVDAVRAAAEAALPGYMVPTVWTCLDDIALNAAGKIDRRSLPAPDIAPTSADYVAPETAIEEAIAAVFADVLDVERVSATASFFDVGGNSLSATRVRSRLKERNGVEIELSWLFSAPSPRALAARIAAGNEEANDVLIALRADGTRPPLFCIHPAGGLAWFYGGLLPYLPDRPVYGLQDPHVVAGEPVYSDVAEMASRYVEEIRRVQPEGPYRILGWSVGGVIAYAMANQLESAGETIAYLGVMDAQPEDPEAVARAMEQSGDQPSIDAEDVMDVLGGWRELFDLGDDVTADTPEGVTEIIRSQIAGMGLFGDGQVERIMTSFATAGEVSLTLRPEPFGGEIQVFVATADKADPATMVDAWRPHVAAVREQFVDTHHLGMTDAASLAVIGPRIAAALSEADV
nr:non-ribosomal peptide synthetase [Gordonia neofelifaecis]